MKKIFKNNKNLILDKKHKNNFFILIIIFLGFFFFILGFKTNDFFNFFIKKNSSKLLDEDQNFEHFKDVYIDIQKNWYFSKDFKDDIKKELIYKAITGMINSKIDLHSFYENNSYKNYFSNFLNYNNLGFTCVNCFNDMWVINKVFENSIAEKNGLLVGDILISINKNKDFFIFDDNEKSIVDYYKYNNILNIINTDNIKNDKFFLNLEILRNDTLLEFDFFLDIKEDFFINADVINNKIGYLEISSFNEKISSVIEEKLLFFKKNKIFNLIIDLRDNKGGFLNSVNELAKYFFDNNTVIFKEENNKGIIKEHFLFGSKKKNFNFNKIIILINENTASAAEIFSLLMKENKKAILIGEKSFGKGTIQSSFFYNFNNSNLKLTTSKWFSNFNSNIHNIGIKPDLEVILNPALTIFKKKKFNFDKNDVIKLNQIHDSVSYIQKALIFLGYGDNNSFRTDGLYDEKTKKFLMLFKINEKLPLSEDIDINVIKKIIYKTLILYKNNLFLKDNQIKSAIDIILND